jgi:hypothetical protein
MVKGEILGYHKYFYHDVVRGPFFHHGPKNIYATIYHHLYLKRDMCGKPIFGMVKIKGHEFGI